MSEFKGTPGPWSVYADTSVESELAGFICDVCGDSTSWEEDQYNANLIAAAPVLLKELQAVMFDVMANRAAISDERISEIRAAIAKAFGE